MIASALCTVLIFAVALRPSGAVAASSSSQSLTKRHGHKRDIDLLNACIGRFDTYSKNDQYRGVACQRTNDHRFKAQNVDSSYDDMNIIIGDNFYSCVYMKVGDESAFWTWTPDSSEFCTYFTGKHCKVDMDANDLVCPKMTDDEVKQFKSDVATRYHHLRYHFWHDGEFQPEFVAW